MSWSCIMYLTWTKEHVRSQEGFFRRAQLGVGFFPGWFQGHKGTIICVQKSNFLTPNSPEDFAQKLKEGVGNLPKRMMLVEFNDPQDRTGVWSKPKWLQVCFGAFLGLLCSCHGLITSECFKQGRARNPRSCQVSSLAKEAIAAFAVPPNRP